ncbi:MAG TPA: PhoH family protein, partial [Nostocaceae cyanobacterium]|nr:PhoH family protein [Nostocaceae cyanobacterium]
PLYDAINEFIEPEKVPNLMERGIIEVAPLAYMRGRTLNNAFIIVDEAQNTTPAQMKMVLTRLGFGSKMVITGDVTQTDLPLNQKSGLTVALQILEGIESIGFSELTQQDVVRHPLVQRIVAAYEKYEE